MKNTKKILALLMVLALLFAAGCTNGEEPIEPAETAETEDRSAEDASGSGAAEQPAADEFAGHNAKAEEAYLRALEDVVTQGMLPGGTTFDVLGYGEGDWTNRYAICDIDGDGKNELIIRIADTIMASITENIYSYDEEGDAILQELWACPVCQYYNDGLAVESGWSHGTGMETGDFWPFNAFVYDPETDTYELAGFASQYTLERMQEMGREAEFPADADEDCNGIVYQISNGEDELFFADDTVYQEWREGIFGTGDPIDLPWHELSELAHPNE